jgi:hypothetical protein
MSIESLSWHSGYIEGKAKKEKPPSTTAGKDAV